MCINFLCFLTFKILSYIGENLTFLDLSGGVMGRLTDDGLSAITTYCMNLEHIALSLLTEVTGVTLIPLLRDSSRAAKFTKLNLSCRRVSKVVSPFPSGNPLKTSHP